MGEDELKQKDKHRKVILIVCNVALIAVMIVATLAYSRHVSKTQVESKKSDFVRTIESLKQVSQNYLDSEKGYVKDWSAYITSQNMTMEEALDFLRSINTNQTRIMHIVDMDTYEAYSSWYPRGEEKIDTYVAFKEQNATESEVPFSKIMEGMFQGNEDEFSLLGKYRLDETKTYAVGVGTKVTLSAEDGTKDYLLLRIVPVEILKKVWIFPTDFSSAEVGIITSSGDYVVQSESMKSQNFLEYIRGYNFQDDYNKVTKLKQRLQSTKSGMSV